MATPKTRATVVSTVDLAPDMSGYQLRLRNVVFEPGDVSGMHSHQERPAFSYILEGTPPGGRVSPWAAHLSLLDILDLWADRWRRQYARGDVSIGRDADDCIGGFEPRDAAARFWRELRSAGARRWRRAVGSCTART